jgi:hypothetical protein
MKKILTILAFSLVCGFSARADQWTGYISDAGCAKKQRAKAASGEHADCAQKCVNKGDKAVLATEDGRVFQIANQDDVLAHVGMKVQVDGEIKGDIITVHRVSELSDDGS